MALTVKDIMKLPTIKKLTLVSGESGLDRYVVSSGIVEHEYSGIIDCEPVFDKESFVVSSLLFAAGNPSLILTALKDLNEQGISAFAYKNVIFNSLPREVLDFSNEVGLPIFSYGTDVYSENVVFDVMTAVKRDDAAYLSEENIKMMIDGTIPSGQLENIISKLSISFKSHICCFYINQEGLDAGYFYRRYVSHIGFTDKIIMCRYHEGLFLITTSDLEGKEAHYVIANQFMELIGLDIPNLHIGRSSVHKKNSLDTCFKESFHCFTASAVDNRKYTDYDRIGFYKVLIPYAAKAESQTFLNDIISKLQSRPEFLNTAEVLVNNGGDIMSAAIELNTHHSTVRYRWNKIKLMLNKEDMSDYEFYKEISLAVAIKKISALLF